MTETMRAVVIREAGAPEVLRIEHYPLPVPNAEQVLIRVEAFGLNRSEMFTRQGHSLDVIFPRILGIEATGIVAAAPAGQFDVGEKVATVMGGMGRAFDGGYAEYVCAPARQVRAFRSSLPWHMLGALPEICKRRGARCFVGCVCRVATACSYGAALPPSAWQQQRSPRHMARRSSRHREIRRERRSFWPLARIILWSIPA